MLSNLFISQRYKYSLERCQEEYVDRKQKIKIKRITISNEKYLHLNSLWYVNKMNDISSYCIVVVLRMD